MRKVPPYIFLADDDEDDCMLFEDALRQIDRESRLTIANDGQELIQTLQTKVPPPPDVIFLDINMPRKNGYECLDTIRSTDKWKNIPVVIFSTSNQTDAIQKMYDMGADYYVFKPKEFSHLKKLIGKILSFNFKEMASPTKWENFIISPR